MKDDTENGDAEDRVHAEQPLPKDAAVAGNKRPRLVPEVAASPALLPLT